MEKNIFQLDNEQLKEIARSFKAKVEEGLNTENAEIQCIPTFITPKASSIKVMIDFILCCLFFSFCIQIPVF